MTSSQEFELPGLGPGPEEVAMELLCSKVPGFSFDLGQNQLEQALKSILVNLSSYCESFFGEFDSPRTLLFNRFDFIVCKRTFTW